MDEFLGSVMAMTANERLRELLKEFDNHPEKTCPQLDTGKSCEGCKYFKNQHCDIDGRRVDFLLKNGVILPPATLDEKIKEAARLRYNNGRTIAEIGEIMGYSTRQIGRFLKRFEEET